MNETTMERAICACGEMRDDFGACWVCDAMTSPTCCEVCEERDAEWETGGGAGAVTRACSVCVDCHAMDRMEPGVIWTRIDGRAIQCDGMVVIR